MYSLALFVDLTLLVQAPPTSSTNSLSYGDKTARVSADDLAKLPRVQATVRSHNVEGTYEGPQLRDVLASVDVPHGDALPGPEPPADRRHRCRRRVSGGLFAGRARPGVPRSPGNPSHATKRPSRWMLPKVRSGWSSPTKHVPPAGPPGHRDQDRGRQTLAVRASDAPGGQISIF